MYRVWDMDWSQSAAGFGGGKAGVHQRIGEVDLATASLGGATWFSAGKYYDAFPIDGVGDLKPITLNTVLLLTPDGVADDTSTTASVTVGGGSVVSTIDMIGDQDFFQVELVAGNTYDIGQYAAIGGPSLVPLSDAYIELYDAAGNFIISADGGGRLAICRSQPVITIMSYNIGCHCSPYR